MDEDNPRWSDISRKRNHLLTKSDWTQLPDAGLSRLCVMEWREWRQEVRSIDQDEFKEIIPAVLELTRLEDEQPTLEYGEADLETRKEAIIGPIEFRNRVNRVLDELGITGKTGDITGKTGDSVAQEPSESVPSIDSMDIRSARKHAQSELEKAYRDRVVSVSPPVELGYLYQERLTQAIDLLSGNGENFPFLQLLAEELEEPIEQVAGNILKQQSTLIGNLMKIEKEYIECLKEIKKSDTIGGIKKLLEAFNGR